VNVCVGMGVKVSGTDDGVNDSVEGTLVDDSATAGEGEAGVRPVVLQARVVNINKMRRYKFLLFMD